MHISHYFDAKVQSFLFVYNSSLYETAKMYCEAAIYSFEAIIGIIQMVVGKCDVEENDDIAMEFGVRNIPTILFFVYYNYMLFISQLLFL